MLERLTPRRSDHESGEPSRAGSPSRRCDVLNRSGFMANPVLPRASRTARCRLDAFRRTQEQFFFAVTFFPRPMAALVGRIPDRDSASTSCTTWSRNTASFRSSGSTTTRSSNSCAPSAASRTNSTSLSLWPAVRAFNSVLTAACVLDELEVGVACMGDDRTRLLRHLRRHRPAVVQRGWVASENLVHYKLHAEIDERPRRGILRCCRAGLERRAPPVLRRTRFGTGGVYFRSALPRPVRGGSGRNGTSPVSYLTRLRGGPR